MIPISPPQFFSPPSTPNRTPISMTSRPYLNANSTMHQYQSPSQESGMMQDHSDMSLPNRGVIYGTTIDTIQTNIQLTRFILEFETNHEVMVDGIKKIIPQKVYYEEFKSMQYDEEKMVLNVSGNHLMEYDSEMYYKFIYFPAEMISLFDNCLKLLFKRYFVDNEMDEQRLHRMNERKEKLMIGITSLEEISVLRNLTHKDINKLISFKGIVIRCSEIQPQMKSAFFECQNCNWQFSIQLENARVSQPKECQRCRSKLTMQIRHNKCTFTDKQFIKFQELPEYVPDGQTPQSITIVAYDSNVNELKAGDRIDIIGVYRAQPFRVQRSRRVLKSVFSTYVDLITFGVNQQDRYKVQTKARSQNFDEDEKRAFYEAARDGNIVDKLIGSFAPSIFGNEEVKKGILALLFGGTDKKFSETGNGRFRCDINILLVGDPSTAKSQLLQQVFKIAPRGVYTSGRGSSAVGLTANVRKDPETREFVLQSGALVMSDMGVCCIDEFDKMDDNNKTILLEVMEQQTISIAKAGIVCSLKSRTSIMAAANPVNSKYNLKKSVVQNINLPPSLLSRFDLIYLMLDKAVESYDTKLAHHILDMYSKDKTEIVHEGIFTRTFLTDYITFAKINIHPTISDHAANLLSKAYVEMRSMGTSKKTITATPRQLESLIRLSEALAKMRLSPLVQESDVNEAINLMRIATQQSAIDPNTGCIDMDVINTGRSTAFRNRIKFFADALKDVIKANITKFRKGVSFAELTQQIQQLSPVQDDKITDIEVREVINVLVSEDLVLTTGTNRLKPTIKVNKDNFVQSK